MKMTSTTSYTLDFPMKDGKKIHTFKVLANGPVEAEDLLYEELMQCLDQISLERKKRKTNDN